MESVCLRKMRLHARTLLFNINFIEEVFLLLLFSCYQEECILHQKPFANNWFAVEYMALRSLD